MDKLGYHGLSYCKSLCCQARHASLNDLVKASLTAIDTPNLLEPPGVYSGQMESPLMGLPVWELTCADTIATSYVSLASTGAGLVTNQAEQRKRQSTVIWQQGATHLSQLQWRLLGSLGGSHAFLQASWIPS